MDMVAEVFVPMLAGPGVTEATHDWFARFADSFRATDPLVFRIGLGAIAGLDHLPRLSMLDVPTPVIHGEADLMVPFADGEAIAAAVPGARLAPLPGVGHMSNLEAPDAFHAALVPFLEATASG